MRVTGTLTIKAVSDVPEKSRWAGEGFSLERESGWLPESTDYTPIYVFGVDSCQYAVR